MPTLTCGKNTNTSVKSFEWKFNGNVDNTKTSNTWPNAQFGNYVCKVITAESHSPASLPVYVPLYNNKPTIVSDKSITPNLTCREDTNAEVESFEWKLNDRIDHTKTSNTWPRAQPGNYVCQVITNKRPSPKSDVFVVINICSCDNGNPAQGVDCTSNNAHICV
jgi:hypothetical protein